MNTLTAYEFYLRLRHPETADCYRPAAAAWLADARAAADTATPRLPEPAAARDLLRRGAAPWLAVYGCWPQDCARAGRSASAHSAAWFAVLQALRDTATALTTFDISLEALHTLPERCYALPLSALCLAQSHISQPALTLGYTRAHLNALKCWHLWLECGNAAATTATERLAVALRPTALLPTQRPDRTATPAAGMQLYHWALQLWLDGVAQLQREQENAGVPGLPRSDTVLPAVAPMAATQLPTTARPPPPLPPIRTMEPVTALRTHGVRECFFHLLQPDLDPQTGKTAARIASRVLRLAAWRRRPQPGAERYLAGALRTWVEHAYQRAADEYRPLRSSPQLSRETYLWGIQQFAPMVLIDGVWLERNHWSGGRLPPWRAALFRTFADEIGAGCVAQNHPWVYQQLLHSVNLTLPPVDSPEFATHPGFLTSAFDLPVFLLAVSRQPRSLLPELLGLNLAIELSGLGKVYLRLEEELRYWAIDPTIVRLHTCVDNLATGHARLAVEAAEQYLLEVDEASGANAAQHAWARVRRGYAALDTATLRFRCAVLATAAKRHWQRRWS